MLIYKSMRIHAYLPNKKKTGNSGVAASMVSLDKLLVA